MTREACGRLLLDPVLLEANFEKAITMRVAVSADLSFRATGFRGPPSRVHTQAPFDVWERCNFERCDEILVVLGKNLMATVSACVI